VDKLLTKARAQWARPNGAGAQAALQLWECAEQLCACAPELQCKVPPLAEEMCAFDCARWNIVPPPQALSCLPALTCYSVRSGRACRQQPRSIRKEPKATREQLCMLHGI
jgi:hypothetical protein